MAFNGEIFEILSRLPAKDLYRFAAVAKPCLEFLSEPYFIEKQCQHSWSDNTDTGFFMQEDSCLRGKAMTSKFSVGVPLNSLEFIARKGRVLASSNGLVLCRTVNNRKPTKLFLCNPVTKEWSPIKLPTKALARTFQYNADVRAVLLCKGGDKFPLDYTVLLFTLDESRDWSMDRSVYLLEEGSWTCAEEKLQVGGRDLDFDHPVHCKDGLYFMSDCGDYFQPCSPFYWPYVIQFDLHEKKSVSIPLPHEARASFMVGSMAIFGWQTNAERCFDSVCLVKWIYPFINVWILGKDRKTWNLHVTLNVDDLGIMDPMRSKMSFTLLGKKLVFATNTNVYSYDLVGKNQATLELICENSCGSSERVRFTPYSTTLRPCKINQKKTARLIR